MTTATIGELENAIKIYSRVTAMLAELTEEQERLRQEIITAFKTLLDNTTFTTSWGQTVRVPDGQEIIIEE